MSRVIHIREGALSDGRPVMRCGRLSGDAIGCAQPSRYDQVTCKDCLKRSQRPGLRHVYIPRNNPFGAP